MWKEAPGVCKADMCFLRPILFRLIHRVGPNHQHRPPSLSSPLSLLPGPESPRLLRVPCPRGRPSSWAQPDVLVPEAVLGPRPCGCELGTRGTVCRDRDWMLSPK